MTPLSMHQSTVARPQYAVCAIGGTTVTVQKHAGGVPRTPSQTRLRPFIAVQWCALEEIAR